MPTKITIESIDIEQSDDGRIHIIYVPDVTHVLQAGKKYEFIFYGTVVTSEQKREPE